MPPTERPAHFHHLPEYRVLVCTTCRYCVLSQALERLLKVIHHLPHRKRRQYIEDARNLDLAEFHDVVHPSPDSAPISGLPVSNGYACKEAHSQYLSVTRKRMQSHWRTAHPQLRQSVGTEGFRARKCQLQTFFQGSNIRYFTVTDLSDSDASQESGSAAGAAALPLQKSLCDFNTAETSMEWLLTKRFTDHSYSTLLPVMGSASSWRDQMLWVSKSAGFLRYAMLSVTANHITFEHPDSRALYGAAADKFHLLAIKELRTCKPTTEPEDFFCVFNFSRLITMSSLARLQLS